MALQLKNKVKEDNKEPEKGKKGKYKRKRNVFGKRLTRFGLFGMIIGLLIGFAVVKVTFTLNQNKKQNKIDNDLTEVNKNIAKYRDELGKKQDTYANVGELIATLPASFDQQATSLDLDRMIILAGLSESTTYPRKMVVTENLPIECSVSTVKAVQIDLTLYGKQDDVESALKFMNYLTNYDQENFYYIDEMTYSEDRSGYKRSVLKLTLFTFYNDIDLTPETQSETTTTK